jgi:anti-anti-sigma regulatory factor
MRLWQHPTFRYLCYGAFFGVLFPLIATVADVWFRGLPLTLAAVAQVQMSQPLHWIIDTAPFFLGFLAALVGQKQQQLVQSNATLTEQNAQLEATVRRAERAEEIARLSAENARLSAQERAHFMEIELAHQQLEQATHTIRSLALPLIPIQRGVLVLPMIGTFNAVRMADLSSILLGGVEQHGAQVVILDYTGVEDIDPPGVATLLEAIQALGLLGASAVLTGITPAVAQRLVDSAMRQDGLWYAADLAGGIAQARALMGDMPQPPNQ